MLKFCRLKDLKATPNAAPLETLATVDEKIKDLKRQHQEDIELLTAFQAAEYRQEVLSRYNCLDDSMMGVDKEDLAQVEYLAALDVRLFLFAAWMSLTML